MWPGSWNSPGPRPRNPRDVQVPVSYMITAPVSASPTYSLLWVSAARPTGERSPDWAIVTRPNESRATTAPARGSLMKIVPFRSAAMREGDKDHAPWRDERVVMEGSEAVKAEAVARRRKPADKNVRT